MSYGMVVNVAREIPLHCVPENDLYIAKFITIEFLSLLNSAFMTESY